MIDLLSLSNLDLARGHWQVCLLNECRVREQDGIHYIEQQGKHQYGRPHAVRTRQLIRNIHGAHEQCAVSCNNSLMLNAMLTMILRPTINSTLATAASSRERIS